ncbi:MAG: integrase core domain-containing protein [Coriobacteriaceae bacterium]
MRTHSLFASMHVEQSLDGKARRRDNASMKRWIGTLKGKCLRQEEYSTPAELKDDHLEARHTWYSEERTHYALSGDTPAQWYRSIVYEATCPSMVLSVREGIQKGSGFPCLTGSDTSQNRRHL